MAAESSSSRPFSTGSVISPHSALEALSAGTSPQGVSSPPRPPSAVASASTSPPRIVNSSKRQSRTMTGPLATSPDGSPKQGETLDEYEESDQRRLLVQALFSYHATDNSALSFEQGDIIEVFTMLESGWWDGMVHGERGWFPSNYVAEISEDEVEDMIMAEEEEEEARRRDVNGASDNRSGDETETDGAGPSRVIRNGDRESGTIEMGPNGEVNAMDEEILALEDDLDEDWNNWGASGSGSKGLEELARDMMSDEPISVSSSSRVTSNQRQTMDEDEAREFEDEISRRRQRLNDLGDLGEFGQTVPVEGIVRSREEADRTLRQDEHWRSETFGQKPGAHVIPAEQQDAWIPSMTPDGRIYYHNTQTGDDSWDLPISLTNMDDDQYYGNEDDFFNTFPASGPSSAAYATHEPDEFNFRSPRNDPGGLPFPWIARLSDDGKEYLYVNQKTGQTSKRPPLPMIETTTDRMKRASIGSLSPITTQRPMRMSMDLHKKAVEEWQRHARETLTDITSPKSKPTMGYLIDGINDALREVLEAAAAGFAAAADFARAENEASQAAFATAALREESAVDLLISAHTSALSAIRELFTAFGYVGPIDKMDDMPPRPTWAGDVNLIGGFGLLAASVHAATVSKRQPDDGIAWTGVVQAARKVQDLIEAMPNSILEGRTISGGLSSAEGKLLEGYFGISPGNGELMGGKWGFSKPDIPLRALDPLIIQEVSRLRADLEIALRGLDEDTMLEVETLATRFLETVTKADIASAIDIDYSPELTSPIQEDVRTYLDLIDKARRALHQLDAGCEGVLDACGMLIIYLPLGDIQRPIELLSSSITAIYRSLSTLSIVSQEQNAAVEQGVLPGKIGIRSYKYRSRPSHSKSRPQSALSSSSKTSTSRRSVKDIFRRKARGLEEEFPDQEDYEEDLQGEERDRPGHMITASGSQLSLVAEARVGAAGGGEKDIKKKGTMSAASSSTSLAYQQTESDSSSLKGSNRSSFMKAVPFLRNRSGSGNAEDARERNKAGNKKLAKLLGEDSLASAVPITPRPSLPPVIQTPWYLGSDYGPGEIVYDDKGGVKAGTLRAFIERLTSHVSTESAFLQAFLLTYRSFASGDEIVDLLLERYHIAPPAGLTPEELNEWRTKKQTPIRLRVSNTFKAWLDHYMEADDVQILDRIEEFAKVTLVADGSLLPSKSLLQGVQRRRTADPNSPRGRIPWSSPAPTPLLPRTLPGKSLKLLDISPLELARQLTILESGHFQRIRPIECLNKAWQREDGAKVAPNLRFVILTANRMAGWVASEILSQKDVKQRALVMKHFVVTAINLRDLNNFSSMAGVVAGLNSAPITRLKRTKELLSTKTIGYQQDLDKTLDSAKNFANYKELLKNINPPCVPFFGFYLSALTFIEDGNKDTIQVPLTPSASVSGSMTPSTSRSTGMSLSASSASIVTGTSSTAPLINPNSSSSAKSTVPPPNPRPISESSSNQPSSSLAHSTSSNTTAPSSQTHTQTLINFFKRSLSAEILRDIKQYQIQPYNLQQYPPVFNFIKEGLEAVEKMGDPYELSLKLEPREREDERITRMLHDSRNPPPNPLTQTLSSKSSSSSTSAISSSPNKPTNTPPTTKSKSKFFNTDTSTMAGLYLM